MAAGAFRKMDHFSRVILVLAVSEAFELGLATGLGHRGLVRPAPGGVAFGDNDLQPREGPTPALRLRSSRLVPPTGIQDSRTLNKTCCANGGTCILGSFCACAPSFYGRNCEHSVHRRNCGPVPHGSWLPRKCSLCKCWHGQLRCLPQTFLPGCEGRVVDERLTVSRTPESALPAYTTFLLLALCFSLEIQV